jgi:hypothetical protein
MPVIRLCDVAEMAENVPGDGDILEEDMDGRMRSMEVVYGVDKRDWG